MTDDIGWGDYSGISEAGYVQDHAKMNPPIPEGTTLFVGFNFKMEKGQWKYVSGFTKAGLDKFYSQSQKQRKTQKATKKAETVKVAKEMKNAQLKEAADW